MGWVQFTALWRYFPRVLEGPDICLEAALMFLSYHSVVVCHHIGHAKPILRGRAYPGCVL
jgi:hypothetical protein